MLHLLCLSCAMVVLGNGPSSVYLWGECVPTELRLGDVVFMRISAHNRGDSPVKIPAGGSLEAGTLSVEISDREEFTTFNFVPEGCPMGGDLPEIVLKPGEGHVIALLMLRVPQLDWTRWRFWDPRKWRPADYYLDLQCRELQGRSEKIFIGCRPEKEMAALLEYYDGGSKAPAPPGWDVDRPTLGVFGLLSYPLACSLPEELAKIEKLLSPGSLWDIVHASRLTAAAYDAGSLREKRDASAALIKWLEERPEIQREVMAADLVSWARVNKGLGAFCFEFVDHLIPLLPETAREKARRGNDESRRRYLEYLRQTKDNGAAKRADGQKGQISDTPPILTADQVRLIGTICRSGGEVWLPGRAWRPWEPRSPTTAVGVVLPCETAAAELFLRLAELGGVEISRDQWSNARG
jgi:hypothetical protein